MKKCIMCGADIGDPKYPWCPETHRYEDLFLALVERIDALEKLISGWFDPEKEKR